MRVLHCIPSLAVGGAERQLAYLAGGLVNAGVQVHVAYHTCGEFRKPLEQGGAVLHSLRLLDNRSPDLVAQIFRQIRKIQPDLVQTWLLQMDVAAGLAALFADTPFILSERASALAYPRNWKTAARKWIGKRAVFVAANSNTGRAYWAPVREPESVKVIRNGIPFDHLEKLASLPCDTPTVDPEAEIILFAGRFSAEKNVHNLLEALPSVFRLRPNAVALLFGDGPLKGGFVHYVERRGMSERIKVENHTAQLRAWMKRASLLVSSSVHEGCPNVVCEAAALRCPLLLSDIPAHRELMSDDSATFVRVDSVPDIARGILQCLQDPIMAARKAGSAYKAISHFSTETMVRAYLDLYHQALPQVVRNHVSACANTAD